MQLEMKPAASSQEKINLEKLKETMAYLQQDGSEQTKNDFDSVKDASSAKTRSIVADYEKQFQ